MNRYVKIGAAAVATVSAVLPAVEVMSASPASAQGSYPAGCSGWTTGWAWGANCWVGANTAYQNSSEMVEASWWLFNRYALTSGAPADSSPLNEFGTKNLYEVKAFQKAVGLNQDGIIGTQTWTKGAQTQLKQCSEIPSNGSYKYDIDWELCGYMSLHTFAMDAGNYLWYYRSLVWPGYRAIYAR